MEEINRLLGISVKKCGEHTVKTIIRNLARRMFQEPNHIAPETSADYEGRINFSSKFFKWTPLKPKSLQKLTKDNKVSAALRTKGNEFFGKRDLQQALTLYNSAILFAEVTGEELGLAFANRSAVKLEQKDPKGGLKDIELALQNNYPERLMGKLEKRREKFVAMLEDIEMSDVIEDVKADMASRRKFRDEEILKLKNPSPTIPSAEDFVEIQYTANGRQLVVNKDVSVGTVVIVERPFTAVNGGLLKFEASRCDNCWKFIKNGIPCERCVFVMFCSEECRSNAECGYHKLECSCLSSLYFVQAFDLNVHVALRVVCKVGPEELYRLFTARDPSYFGLKKPFGTEQGCKYESDSYLPIHHLVSPASDLHQSTRDAHDLIALQLVSILEARTTFVGVSPKEKRNDFKNFVAAILLRSMETVPLNEFRNYDVQSLHGFTLADVYRRKEVQAIMKEAMKSGYSSFFGNSRFLGVYAVGSLMNHSCDPSVLRVNDVSHGTTAVVTTRAMKKGEPLTMSHGIGYEKSSLSERCFHSKRDYNFGCNCTACANDWPTDAFLLTKFENPEFTCPSCSKTFSHEEKSCGEFLKCCLSTSRTTCRLCGKSYKIGTLDRGYKKAIARFEQGLTDLVNNRPLEALKASTEVAEYLQFNIRPPHGIAGSNRYTSTQALALILHFAE